MPSGDTDSIHGHEKTAFVLATIFHYFDANMFYHCIFFHCNALIGFAEGMHVLSL